MPKSTLVQVSQTVDPLLALTTMTASGCLPCQERQQQEKHASASDTDDPDLSQNPVTGWSGVIGVEGEMTGDGRLIEANALRWENLPLPLRYVGSDVGAHDGAQVVGRITSISRGEDGQILAEGDFDMASPAGVEAARQVEQGLTNGVSMDLDDVSFEVRIAKELMEGDGMGFPMFLATELPAEVIPTEGEELPDDQDDHVTVMEINADDEVRVTTDGRIRAATIVAIPAFAGAQIHLTGEVEPAAVTETEDDVLAELVAAAAPLAPPAAWFNDPRFTGPHALTVTAEGRIFGHLGTWDTCHISYTQRGQCITPPHSASNYAHFHYGAVLTEEGAEIAVGHITMDTRHAGKHDSANVAMSHYEDTGTVIADVRAGEDSYGVWVVGALRPTATPNQVRALRSAPLSGDWRSYGTDLELVAALAVNVPGFGVPRPSGLVAGGTVRSLVAAGMLAPRQVKRPGTEGALSLDDLRYLKRLADRERAEEQSLRAGGALPAATDLARRVRASTLAMRVQRARPSK
jgi:hypothetical protein